MQVDVWELNTYYYIYLGDKVSMQYIYICKYLLHYAVFFIFMSHHPTASEYYAINLRIADFVELEMAFCMGDHRGLPLSAFPAFQWFWISSDQCKSDEKIIYPPYPPHPPFKLDNHPKNDSASYSFGCIVWDLKWVQPQGFRGLDPRQVHCPWTLLGF